MSRAKREREVTVVGTPAGPLPEIHVAPETLTVLLFPAAIQEDTLTVDKSRIRVVEQARARSSSELRETTGQASATTLRCSSRMG